MIGALVRGVSSVVRRLGRRFGEPPTISPFAGDVEASTDPAPVPAKPGKVVATLSTIAGAIVTYAPPLFAAIRRRLPRFWDLLLLGGVFLVVLAVSRIASWQLVPEVERPAASAERSGVDQPTPEVGPETGAVPVGDTTQVTVEAPEIDSTPPPRTTPLPPPSPAPTISRPARVAQAAVAVTPERIQSPAGSDVAVAIRVSGSWGRPVVDRTVIWRMESGPGGTLRSESVRTDSQGVARNVIRLPAQAGEVELVARVDDSDLPEVRFLITVLPRGDDASDRWAAGPGQIIDAQARRITHYLLDGRFLRHTHEPDINRLEPRLVVGTFQRAEALIDGEPSYGIRSAY